MGKGKRRSFHGLGGKGHPEQWLLTFEEMSQFLAWARLGRAELVNIPETHEIVWEQ